MSASGVSVDLETIKAIMSWERPKLVFKIHSFLGLARYYRRFIEDFSQLVALMKKLTRKEVKFKWNDLCQRAFQELKRGTYFSSYSDSLGTGTEVHSVL